MNKILLNKVVTLSVLVSAVSFNASAVGEDGLNSQVPEAQKTTAPLAQPTINGSVCSGVYNPEISAIMNAMQTGGYKPTVNTSGLTESARNAALYVMNPPKGN